MRIGIGYLGAWLDSLTRASFTEGARAAEAAGFDGLWFFDAIGVPDWMAQRLWFSSLLFAAGAGDITNVVADGRPVVVDGRHVSIDVATELCASIQDLMER